MSKALKTLGLLASVLAVGLIESLESTHASPVTAIREGSQVVIWYEGDLESGSKPEGPYTRVEGAARPQILDASQTSQFFRARLGSGIFQSASTIPVHLVGPFQENFEKAFAGMPDGIFPPRRETPYFDVTVRSSPTNIPATMRVRGNSSLQECPFPKMKLKISKDARVGTMFEQAREIKIGTHCADGGRGNIGRLRDERAAFREAVAYEAMGLLGFVTPNVRRARIEFVDSSPTNNANPEFRGWTVTRNAMLLEDVEVLAQRMGGEALSDDDVAALRDVGFPEALISELKLLHALLGNWDYSISTDGSSLANTEVIRLANSKLHPVAGDFDLSSWVTEEVRTRAPREYHPELPDVERHQLFDVEEVRGKLKPDEFEQAAARFRTKQGALEALVRVVEVDDAGRSNIVRHVHGFFNALNR